MMLAYISHWGLNTYLNSAHAPLWRALATPDNATALDLAAAVLTALCLAFAIPQLAFRFTEKKMRWLPWLLFLSFFAVPSFMRHMTDLSPVMFTMLPIAMSLAALTCQEMSDYRKFVRSDGKASFSWFGVWLAVAGVCAAVATWEGTLGLAFLLPLMALALTPFARGQRSFFGAMASLTMGYVFAFVLEGVCLEPSWLALKPVLPPWAGLLTFFFIGFIPVMLAQRFGENRWTLGGWAIVLIVFGILSLQAVVGKGESGCEKFVRAVLADRGDRKLIVSDGIFDDFFRVLSPEGVRVIGTRTNKDREFLLNIFDDGEPFTNKALLVRRYYNLPEMALAAAELGFRRRSQPKAPERAAEKTVVVTQEMTKSNMVERLTQAAEPLAKTLTEIETELAKPTGKQNRDVLLRGQQELRATWRQGVFRGTRLSNAVLLADIMLGDLVALESDAITALMIDREDPAANGALGSIRQEQGRFESAERYLRKGVKGGGVFAMGKLAILLIQTKRPAEAVEWAEKAVKLAPTDISLREPLAAALVECGRLDEADAAIREIARQAVATDTIVKETPFLAGVRKRLAAKRKEAGMKESGK